jgi:hypothetical protein
MDDQSNTGALSGELSPDDDRRFFVRASSINEVRRALFRAPGGAEVVGRYDRETIECRHTMDPSSLRRNGPIIRSRLTKAGLKIVPRPVEGSGSSSF